MDSLETTGDTIFFGVNDENGCGLITFRMDGAEATVEMTPDSIDQFAAGLRQLAAMIRAERGSLN